MTSAQKIERARINGICCVADGEIHPFSSDLPTILRAVEVAAKVGLRLRLDESQVKVLQRQLAIGRENVFSPPIESEEFP